MKRKKESKREREKEREVGREEREREGGREAERKRERRRERGKEGRKIKERKRRQNMFYSLQACHFFQVSLLLSVSQLPSFPS